MRAGVLNLFCTQVPLFSSAVVPNLGYAYTQGYVKNVLWYARLSLV